MTHVSTSMSLSGLPLLSLLPARARFQAAMAPGMQHQPWMSYLLAGSAGQITALTEQGLI